MSEQQTPSGEVAAHLDDDMTVAESIGLKSSGGPEDEGVEVGHGGAPIFWIVAVVFVLVWAMLAWKPWGGY